MFLIALVKKILQGLLTLLLVASLTFVLIRLLPGGPFNDPKVPEAVLKALEAKYHLNAPLWEQYTLYVGNLLRGDLGPSFANEAQQVTTIVQEGFGASLKVGLPALLLGSGLGFGLASVSVLFRRPWLAGVLNSLAMGALSLPSFIAAGALVWCFAMAWPILPAAVIQNNVSAYTLPVITLALGPFAFSYFLTQTALQQTLGLPFVQHKLQMGLPFTQVAMHHVCTAAWLPLLSLLGPLAANVLTGSFAVETIFAIPGLGRHFVTAVLNRDYTVVMGVTLLYSAFLIALNTLSDVVLLKLDPRLRQTA